MKIFALLGALTATIVFEFLSGVYGYCFDFKFDLIAGLIATAVAIAVSILLGFLNGIIGLICAVLIATVVAATVEYKFLQQELDLMNVVQQLILF